MPFPGKPSKFIEEAVDGIKKRNSTHARAITRKVSSRQNHKIDLFLDEVRCPGDTTEHGHKVCYRPINERAVVEFAVARSMKGLGAARPHAPVSPTPSSFERRIVNFISITSDLSLSVGFPTL